MSAMRWESRAARWMLVRLSQSCGFVVRTGWRWLGLGLGEKAIAEKLEGASGWEAASMYSGVEIWRRY